MVAADPQSDKNLIVCGFRTNQRMGSAYEGYVYQSSDGGRTWGEALVVANSQWVSEESCAFGPIHRAYFVAGVSDTSHGVPLHEYGNMRLYRSVDGGKTWRTIQVSPFMDWTAMAVDATNGPQRGTLYIFADSVAAVTGGWRYADRSVVLAVRRELPEPKFSVTNGNSSTATGGKAAVRFPVGSGVLAEGTVLAAFSGEREASDSISGKKTTLFSVEVAISRDGGGTLTKTSVYEHTVPPVLAGLAVNQTTDAIYICWAPSYGEHVEGKMMDKVASKLMLATSFDKGKTWTVSPVTAPQYGPLDVSAEPPSLAVNKDGVLGFMWYGKSWDRVYFGPSFDGGHSLAQVILLTPAMPAGLTRSGELADERRLFVYPPAWNASSHRLEPLRILGFGSNPRGVPFGNALVADASGAFHPIWNEVDNGESHLWTRTLALQTPDKRSLTLAGLVDISDRLVSHISNVRYDHLESLVAFDLTLANKSEPTIGGPLLVVVTSPSGQFDFSADNADNGRLGDGALWEFQIPKDGLRLEQSTEPRTLTFRLHKRNRKELGYRKPRDVPLKIYGKLP